MAQTAARKPPRLKPGDTVRMVSPASAPGRGHIAEATAYLESLGLRVQLGRHAFDKFGYLAGKDEDRLEDLNDAIRDPQVDAILATRGGKGAYRIADRMDFEAMRAHPKLLIGFSEITILHLALYKHCRIASLHGASWTESFSRVSTASLAQAMCRTEAITLEMNRGEATSELTTRGATKGRLLGGNQDMIATANGWMMPDLDDAILLLEAFNLRIGHIDRQLTMLRNSGCLDSLAGIAIGQYTQCGTPNPDSEDWTPVEVLRDRLGGLGIPILGGLPVGHGANPIAVPLGTEALLDADAGKLIVESGVA